MENVKPAITKALPVKESIMMVIPKKFLGPLGITKGSYLEHILENGQMITRVVELPVSPNH